MMEGRKFRKYGLKGSPPRCQVDLHLGKVVLADYVHRVSHKQTFFCPIKKVLDSCCTCCAVFKYEVLRTSGMFWEDKGSFLEQGNIFLRHF